MKNVTITLDEETARWARQCAAEREMSLSRFVGELLQSRMEESTAYGAAMRRYLSKKAAKLKRPGASYPRRDEIHER